jgi:hypothetical protein
MLGKLETVQDRRKAARVKLSRTVLVRPFDFHLSEEVCKTRNLSRTGLYFESPFGHYYAGMDVLLAWNFQPDDTETGKVMRVTRLSDGKWGVAIRIL